MSTTASKAAIMDSLKKLRAVWERSRASWDDDASRALARDVLDALDPRVLAGCKALDEMGLLITTVRRECADAAPE